MNEHEWLKDLLQEGWTIGIQSDEYECNVIFIDQDRKHFEVCKAIYDQLTQHTDGAKEEG